MMRLKPIQLERLGELARVGTLYRKGMSEPAWQTYCALHDRGLARLEMGRSLGEADRVHITRRGRDALA